MESYEIFASYYDRLTENIAYEARACYFDSLLKQYGNSPQMILDLACGTGSLSVVFVKMGYDVMGVDASEAMLTQAAFKTEGEVWLSRQRMEDLILPQKVDAVICALDSLNHVTEDGKLEQIFQKVAEVLKSDGLFIFDMNTPYKHEKVLGDHTFIYELDELYCVWQNEWHEKTQLTEISLDFFVLESDGLYERYSEDFFERSYSEEEVKNAAEKSALLLEAVYEGDTLNPPTETTERWVYVLKKVEK